MIVYESRPQRWPRHFTPPTTITGRVVRYQTRPKT